MTQLFYLLVSILFRVGVVLTRCLPAGWVRPVQRLFVWPAFCWWRRRRIDNIALMSSTIGTGAAADLDRRYRDFHLRMGRQFALHPRQTIEELRSAVAVDGYEDLKTALAAGRGALVTGPHLGYYFYIGAALAVRGIPVTGIVTDLPIASVDRHMRRIAERFGFKTVRAGPAAVREARRCLKRNGVLWVFNDVTSVRSKNQWIPLGPWELWGSTGAAALALAHRAPVFLSTERGDETSHVVRLTRTAGGDDPDPGTPLDLTRRWFLDMFPELSRRPAEWQTLGYGLLRRPGAVHA